MVCSHPPTTAVKRRVGVEYSIRWVQRNMKRVPMVAWETGKTMPLFAILFRQELPGKGVCVRQQLPIRMVSLSLFYPRFSLEVRACESFSF